MHDTLYVSVHVPKTGGSTLREILRQKFGDKLQLAYDKRDGYPREFIEDPACDSISGPPQIVKIYPHARTLPINVLWPPKQPTFVAHYGRPLLDYESSDFACLDLDSMELLSPQQAIERIGG